jgi:hypothetical protein
LPATKRNRTADDTDTRGWAIFHGYNVFSSRGASAYEVNVESSEKPSGSVDALDASLRKLARLKDDGLITEVEYQRKRAEALGQR